MARPVKSDKTQEPADRRKLRPRSTPYWVTIDRHGHLGYRRHKNGGGSWVARYYAGNQSYRFKRLGLADDTLEANGTTILDYWQAQKAAVKWFADKARGDGSTGPYTVTDAIVHYEADYNRRSGRAKQAMKFSIDAYILPELGKVELSKLTPNRLRLWHHGIVEAPARQRGRKTKAPAATDAEQQRRRRATANRVLTVLKAALNLAFHEGHVDSDAAWRRVRPFKDADAPIVRYLSPPEITRLVNTCAPGFRPIVQGALFTGCRYGELCRMTVADYNASTGRVTVRESKGGKPRHPILTEEAAEFFDTITAGRRANEPMFRRPDGEPHKPSDQKRPILAACKAAKINPTISFHILRHTHGSLLAMAGTPMRVIADQLGHADTRMTERHYAHLSPSYVADTIRANMPNLGITKPSKVKPLRKRNK